MNPLSDIGPVSIIDSQRHSRYHCLHVELPGALGMRLTFDNIRLPAGHCVELIDEQRRWIKQASFEASPPHELIIPGSVVTIRVILPQVQDALYASLQLVRVQTHGADPEILALVGKDERQPFVCYEGTDVARFSLASAMMNLGRAGSGSLIGNGNFVLTNWHVVRNEDALRQGRGEIWLNWVHEACDKESPVKTPLMLEADQLLATGNSAGSSDFSLFSLKDFDYTHSQVKRLFGGLRIRETDPLLEEAVFVPQYGNGGLMPMHVSTLHEDPDGVERLAKVVGPVDQNWTKCNADTQGGSSGSPIISAVTGELVGLHGTALGGKNGGPSATRLHTGFGNIIEGYNEAVIGLGKVTVHNLDISDVLPAVFTLDLGKQGKITPFDTVRFEHQSDHTLAHVQGLDLATQELFDTTLKMHAKTDQGSTHLGDPALTGQIEIVVTLVTQVMESRLSRRWLALGVYEGDEYICSAVVRLTCHEFDPFEIPFPVASARILHLQLHEDQSASLVIEGARYGYVAFYLGEGPGELQARGEGYSILRVPVRGVDGVMKIVLMRGYRQREGQLIPMNIAAGGLGNDLVSTLRLEYHATDNTEAELPEQFEGFLPLLGMISGQPGGVDILIRIYAGNLVAPDILIPLHAADCGKRPVVSGRAARGASIEVVKSFNPGARIGNAVADDHGLWALEVEQELLPALNRISARQRSANTSSPWSGNRSFNVFEQLPAPVIASHQAEEQTTGIVFGGSALPGSIVRLYDSESNTLLAEVHSSTDGFWSTYLAQKPQEGPLTLHASQQLGEQVSPSSPSLELTVIAGLEPPLIIEPMADAMVAHRAVFRGRALAGSTVTVASKGNPGNVVARATADGEGNWEAPALKDLPAGPYAVSARQAGSGWSGNRGFGVLDDDS